MLLICVLKFYPIRNTFTSQDQREFSGCSDMSEQESVESQCKQHHCLLASAHTHHAEPSEVTKLNTNQKMNQQN